MFGQMCSTCLNLPVQFMAQIFLSTRYFILMQNMREYMWNFLSVRECLKCANVKRDVDDETKCNNYLNTIACVEMCKIVPASALITRQKKMQKLSIDLALQKMNKRTKLLKCDFISRNMRRCPICGIISTCASLETSLYAGDVWIFAKCVTCSATACNWYL